MKDDQQEREDFYRDVATYCLMYPEVRNIFIKQQELEDELFEDR